MAFWHRLRDEDDVDRANRVWTVLSLLVTGVALFVYLAVFPDSAIWCQIYDEGDTPVASSTQVNRYCLDEGTLPSSSFYDDAINTYHAWVPLLLFFQILGFVAPHALSQVLKRFLGSESEFLFLYAETNPQSSRYPTPPQPSKSSTIIYLLKKALYVLNAFLQVILVGVFLSPDKSLEGITTRYVDERSESPFPRYGRCKFQYETYKSQDFFCTYHVNGILHKIYLIIYYWFIFLLLANVISLVAWILLLIVPRFSASKIRMYISDEEAPPNRVMGFVKDCLGMDFLLNAALAQSKGSEVTVADLTLKYWRFFAQKEIVLEGPIETFPNAAAMESTLDETKDGGDQTQTISSL